MRSKILSSMLAFAIAAASAPCSAAEENFIFGVSEADARDTVVCSLHTMADAIDRISAAVKVSGQQLTAEQHREVSAAAAKGFHVCIAKAGTPLEASRVEDCFLQSVYLPEEADVVRRGVASRATWESVWLARVRDGEIGEARKDWLRAHLQRLMDQPAPSEGKDSARASARRSLDILNCTQRGGPMVRFDLST